MMGIEGAKRVLKNLKKHLTGTDDCGKINGSLTRAIQKREKPVGWLSKKEVKKLLKKT